MRLPDFLIIGTMKSGTTTLYRWLAQHPRVSVPETKEPNFFSDERRWRRGVTWYGTHFRGIPSHLVTGEASVSYAAPDRGRLAAERIRRTLPRARLICLVRHPLERMRSHYHHEVQRGRERRRFEAAVADLDNPYLGYSLYSRCLEPYLETFPRDSLCLVRLEDLTDGDAWERVLDHLGLSHVPRPVQAYNVSGQKSGFTPLMRLLWELGAHRPLSRVPPPLRRLGRPLLFRADDGYDRLVESSRGPVPGEVVDQVARDSSRLALKLGLERSLWPELSHRSPPDGGGSDEPEGIAAGDDYHPPQHRSNGTEERRS